MPSSLLFPLVFCRYTCVTCSDVTTAFMDVRSLSTSQKSPTHTYLTYLNQAYKLTDRQNLAVQVCLEEK